MDFFAVAKLVLPVKTKQLFSLDKFATSTDNTYPRKIGNVPATGSIIAAIQKTHPVSAINLGKPSKSIFNLAKKKLNIKRQDILTVGDNLNTDILGSNLSNKPLMN